MNKLHKEFKRKIYIDIEWMTIKNKTIPENSLLHTIVGRKCWIQLVGMPLRSRNTEYSAHTIPYIVCVAYSQGFVFKYTLYWSREKHNKILII